MAQILHSVLEPGLTLNAATQELNYDLPVNPLSALIITLRATNNTTTATNYNADALHLMSKMADITVRYRGATILDGDPADLAMVHGMMSGWWPIQGQLGRTDNDVRSISWPVLFGRRPYDAAECFPATRRGDLTLQITTAGDPTGLDGYQLIVETIELLDAVPQRFVKATTIEQTFSSIGPHEIDLPVGNRILGVLLRAATFPTGTSYNASFNELALTVDNVEVLYSRATWDGLRAIWRRRVNTDWMRSGHAHTENVAATYTQLTSTLGALEDLGVLQRYGYVDMDPLGDLSMALDTREAADVTLDVQSTSADTDSSRAVVIEYVETGAAPAAGG